MPDVASARTLHERTEAAHAEAKKRAQVARVRVSLFSTRDGGVVTARERFVHLDAVARRAERALALALAQAGEADPTPRALHAHVVVGTPRAGAVLDQRAFDTTRQLTHVLPPGVAAALPVPLSLERAATNATTVAATTKRVAASAEARRDSYLEAVGQDVLVSIVHQASRLAVDAP